jgi:flavodoxin
MQPYRQAMFILIIFIPVILLCHAVAEEKKKRFETDNKAAVKALVVVYSYTGNTKAVADEIVKRFNADVVIIKANAYDGLSGALKANMDAWNEVSTTAIKPETVDMRQYRLIFLGAPIWWYRPAVPLWAFVDKNKFKGKFVVLFNTFNSRFKPVYMEKFYHRLKKNGCRSYDHIYVRRGRWYAQLSREELIKSFNRILDKKESDYNKLLLLD